VGYCSNNHNLAFAQKDSTAEAATQKELLQQIKIFEDLNCGSSSKSNQTQYVKEVTIPNKCSIPVAITYDENYDKVWFISTREGILNNFDPSTKKFESYYIPKWSTRNHIVGNSWSWDIKMDNSKSNIWFTDEKQDSLWRFNKPTQTFYQYIIPNDSKYFSTAYPVSIDFDKNGNLYFAGIRTLSLWYGEINKMENSTSKGITKIPIPLNDTFKGIPEYEIGLGSLVVDKDRDTVWATALAFDKKGALIKYDINDKKYIIYTLPKNFTSPVGITLDKEGDIWITDHGTSSFYKISTKNLTNTLNGSNIEHIVTSPLSPRILGLDYYSAPNTPEYQYGNTLPYWIKTGQDNSIWFNEHVGNKLANYNQRNNNTLTEYWIPTQNILYSACKEHQQNTNSCGYANILQFDIENGNKTNFNNNSENIDHRIWFSEQSENKIGYIDLDKNLPISISVMPKEISILSNQSLNKPINLELSISNNRDFLTNPNSNNQESNKSIVLKPTISGTFTPNGELSNIKSIFDPNTVKMNGDFVSSNNMNAIKVKITLNPMAKIMPGNYNIMVGVESKDFSISKKIKLISH
jgi:virginiamycin B lyase